MIERAGTRSYYPSRISTYLNEEESYVTQLAKMADNIGDMKRASTIEREYIYEALEARLRANE